MLQATCAPFALVGETVQMALEFVPSASSSAGSIVLQGGYLEGGDPPRIRLLESQSSGDFLGSLFCAVLKARSDWLLCSLSEC